MKRSTCSEKSRGGLRQWVRLVLPVVLLIGLPGAEHAVARVSPTNYIEAQIQKPNMLVVLDTSGSMNGLPGTPWSSSNEVGVDCDSGFNCRGWGLTGKCSASGRACSVNADCQVNFCELGAGQCLTDVDCPGEYGCQLGGNACATDSDCSVLGYGTCAGSGVPCDLNTPCGDSGNCSITADACTVVGRTCKTGQCQHNKSILCTSDSNCATSNNGTCSVGSTPSGGCQTDAMCPAVGVCSTGESCAVTADCPQITVGTCKKDKNVSCTSNANCPGGGNKCNFPANKCRVQANKCTFNTSTCLKDNKNTCKANSNGCTPATNQCLLLRANRCKLSASTETCVPQPAAGTGTLKMCQRKQTRCTTDSNCPTGDTCGPPTSRTVVAKRTLQTVLSDNANIVNFGFMTFHQSGYFPYYQIAGGTSQTETVFISDAIMNNVGCLGAAGPTVNCRYRGGDYTLIAGNDSRYGIAQGASSSTYDTDWCGSACSIPNFGTGRYVGSTYQRIVTNGTVTTTRINRPTYEGKYTNVAGVPYRYYESNPAYYNGGGGPPIGTINCGSQCSATCGARWDAGMADFLNPRATDTEARQSLGKILEWLEPASYGGLVTYGSTPSGCTLENNVTQTANTSAYHYMSQVTANDTIKCRQNYVLFITDGEANGPGDSNCTATACSAANPQSAGCTCKVVLSAYRLRKNLGVKTFAVGFSSDVTIGNARIINDNVARAGGTDYLSDGVSPFAYMAANEEELVKAIQGAIFEAVRGTYSTSPSTGSSGVQQSGTIAAGKYALDARVDFPSWKGHLLAYDVTLTPPALAWDAGEILDRADWSTRKLYLGSNDGSVIKVDVDPSTLRVVNRSDINNIFNLGVDENEAEKIIKFIMGDPTLGNPARLGSMINSTPIDVAAPGDSPLPGGHEFYMNNKDRPGITYVGADDGMLHAFFTNDTEVNGETMSAGSEAFAFIPPGMLEVVKKLYVQKGQIADPAKHVFGLASSPKVKNLCVQNCNDAVNAIWKSLLIMGEGYGGNGMFVIDVTNPVSSIGFAEPPISLKWHTDFGGIASGYAGLMGQSVSVPAFFFNKTDTMDDYRVIFASGYAVTPNSTTEAKTLIVASASSGVRYDYKTATPGSSCSQEYAMMTDVATSRVNTSGEHNKLRAGYVGDTWGNLWRYDGNTLLKLESMGCQRPLHFSPTVVQLDRDDPTNRSGETFLVQATNSALDDETMPMAPSELIIMHETVNVEGVPEVDRSYGVNGKLILRVGQDNEICGVTNPNGTCAKSMPTNARPTATPMALLKKDGSGFQLMSMWYAPDTAGCTKGATWLVLHQVIGRTVTQVQGMQVANEPVTSPVIAGGRIFVVGSNGTIEITGNLEATISRGSASPTDNVGIGTFNQLSWTEVE